MASGQTSWATQDFRRSSRRAVSTAALEQRLGLPRGAWRRRRLFLLTVRSASMAALGLGPGDRLVVEPGCQGTDGRLVVVRHEGGRLGLARLAQASGPGRPAAHLVSADPSTLPYPLTGVSVVGVVVAQLGSDSAKISSRCAAGPATPESSNALDRRRSKNRARVATAVSMCERLEQDPASNRRALLHRRDRLETLARCLDAVDAPLLYDALVGEINRLLRQMRRLAGQRRAALPQLEPLLRNAPRKRPQQPHKRLARRPARQAAGRQRTDTLNQGVDRAMPEVV